MTTWLSPNEVSSELNISLTHVYSLIAYGKLKANNFGIGEGKKFYRISRKNLDEYISRAAAPEEPERKTVERNTALIKMIRRCPNYLG